MAALPTNQPAVPVDQLFQSRQEAVGYCHNWAKTHGYALVTRSTERTEVNGERVGNQYVTRLVCDRWGTTRKAKVRPGFTVRHRSTKKTNCLFGITVSHDTAYNRWILKVPHDRHNHDAFVVHSQSATIRRQERENNPEITRTIAANWRGGITPRQTWVALRNANPDTAITLKDVRNIYAEQQRVSNQGFPRVQAAMLNLNDTFVFHERMNAQNQLTHLLVFPKQAIQLLCLFPHTVVLDHTYGTNRYKLFMLNIVGMIATNESFLIGSALVPSENEANVAWVLAHLRTVYTENGLTPPLSLTTDRARALINASERVFPESVHLVCAWHVNRAVKGYMHKVIGQILVVALSAEERLLPKEEKKRLKEERKQAAKRFADRLWPLWEAVQYAKTVTAFNDAWASLRRTCLQHDATVFTDYLEKEWMWCQEKFVPAWTNEITHFGNASSNRAESIHRAIKKELPHSNSDIQGVINSLKRYCQVNLFKVVLELANQKESRDDRLTHFIFNECHRVISSYAMKKVLEHCRQWNLMSRHGRPLDACTRVFTTVAGLPCAHYVQRHLLSRLPLSVEDFHDQWRLDRLSELPALGRFELLQEPIMPEPQGRNRPIRRKKSHWERQIPVQTGDLPTISQQTDMSEIYASQLDRRA